ncbi:MAG: NERD domain-containing protein, partial [Candidatus Electrothrix sp. ATG2]|nr:NERD domain-containing protein [Candidatus Electrothrix sp. ATG2]
MKSPLRPNEKVYKNENEGERIMRSCLTSYCTYTKGAHVLNNVTLRFNEDTTQIDHILITMRGILVVETKHYTGWIFGNARQKKWTQVIYKKKYRFQNPLHQNYKHILAVQQALHFVPDTLVSGAIVFTK